MMSMVSPWGQYTWNFNLGSDFTCTRGVKIFLIFILQDHTNEQKEDPPEINTSKHCSDGQTAAQTNEDVTSKATLQIVKKEPEEPPSPPSGIIPEAVSHTKSECQNQQRSSQSTRTDVSKWTSAPTTTEDTRDELTLTAYDVIAGVISTHPIQPLEKDSDVATSQSSSAKQSLTTFSTSITTTTTSSSSSVPPIKSKKDQHTLVQDLDEFSKVMDQVAQEQIAKERRFSSGNELELMYSAHDPTSYLRMKQSCPVESNGYFRQKYIPNQSNSQVDSTYHHKNAKSQLVLPRLCVTAGEPPVSNGNHTPTTPLEHYSFQSPSPHIAGSPVLSSSQTCPPPPYSSSVTGGACYPYTYQNTTSSISEQWPHIPSHQALQRSQQTVETQNNLKEGILTRVSSCVVALSGQKRPVHDSVLPPPKLALMGHHHPNTSTSSLHGYPNSTVPPYPATSPYPRDSTSVTYPHPH